MPRDSIDITHGFPVGLDLDERPPVGNRCPKTCHHVVGYTKGEEIVEEDETGEVRIRYERGDPIECGIQCANRARHQGGCNIECEHQLGKMAI